MRISDGGQCLGDLSLEIKYQARLARVTRLCSHWCWVLIQSFISSLVARSLVGVKLWRNVSTSTKTWSGHWQCWWDMITKLKTLWYSHSPLILNTLGNSHSPLILNTLWCSHTPLMRRSIWAKLLPCWRRVFSSVTEDVSTISYMSFKLIFGLILAEYQCVKCLPWHPGPG